MGQQQVHHVGIFDSKERSMPRLVAMVGICPSGQQALDGGEPVPSRIWLEFVWRNLRRDEVI